MVEQVFVGQGDDGAFVVHRALAVRSRAQIFSELRTANEPLSARTLAVRIGLHINTVRRHLGSLEEAGLVRSHTCPLHGPGRPEQLYEPATPDCGDPHGAYRLLGRILVGAVVTGQDDPVAVSEGVGEVWGRHLGGEPRGNASIGETLARVAALHRGLGQRPTVVERYDPCIALHSCPFAEVAAGQQDVVCGIHRGLVRGVLAQIGAPLRLVEIAGLADCGTHVVRLARRDRSESSVSMPNGVPSVTAVHTPGFSSDREESFGVAARSCCPGGPLPEV